MTFALKMSFLFCTTRDTCRNFCKKKNNVWSALLIVGLFFLAHLCLLSYNEKALTKVGYFDNRTFLESFANLEYEIDRGIKEVNKGKEEIEKNITEEEDRETERKTEEKGRERNKEKGEREIERNIKDEEDREIGKEKKGIEGEENVDRDLERQMNEEAEGRNEGEETEIMDGRKQETEETDRINCNEDCVEAFIDKFLFGEDNVDEYEENKFQSSSPSKKMKKGKRGKSGLKKKKKNIDKNREKETKDENAEVDESDYVLLPTRARGKNHGLYREDRASNLGNTWTQEMADTRQEVFRSRAENVTKACQRLGERGGFFHVNTGKLQDNLRWSQSHHFVWCPIFKSASTTWVKNLLLLAGEKFLTKSLHGRVRELYPKPEDPRDRTGILAEAMKIIIVRHPLDRLLSAYRDKMLRVRSAKDPYVKIQERILEEYKDPSGIEPTSSTGPSGEGSGKKQTFLHPTFSQFLLKVRGDMESFWEQKGASPVNLHWRPYWITCGPCQIKYDVIAQVETLGPDQEYIIRELGLENILYNAHTHASNFDKYNGTSEAAQHYFGQVPIGLLKQIIALYRPDFELFGYSPEAYINLANKTVKKKTTASL